MAFSAPDFYTVACELVAKATKDGPYLRTLISRAYYGALIAARDARHIRTDGLPSSHDFVINSYKGNFADKVISDHLIILRKLRKKADYEPKTDLTYGDALTAVSSSKKVLVALKVLPAPPPKQPLAPPAVGPVV